MSGKEYVLVTAARNEDDYIEKTIQSVISQTILPKEWIIVSDGSTDLTDKIVMKYTEKYDFIHFIRIEPNDKRNFASQAYALKAGVKMLKDMEYEFIGLLDADISFEPNYYEKIMGKCYNNKKIGIVGGWIYESQKGIHKERFGNSIRHVPGAIQMFRRQCYKDVNGYMPLRKGGKDTIAEIMARMNGWETKCFPDLRVFHHRITGTDKCNTLYARYHQGKEDYFLGYHPMFEVLKFLARIKEKPLVIGSIFRFFGYIEGLLSREPIVIPNEVVKYLRKEQMMRIISLLTMKTSTPS